MVEKTDRTVFQKICVVSTPSRVLLQARFCHGTNAIVVHADVLCTYLHGGRCTAGNIFDDEEVVLKPFSMFHARF